jgi:hypothetical protein
MTLAPIRGAPAGASVPGFPTSEAAQPTLTPASSDQGQIPPPVRRRYTPVDIGGGSITLTFRVLPELPAISRASLTVQGSCRHGGARLSEDVGAERQSVSNGPTEWTFPDCRDGRRGWHGADWI